VRYYFISGIVMAGSILLAVALQPLMAAIWPSIDSVAIGGFGASSYIPFVCSIIFTLIAGYWLRRSASNRVPLWAILIAPAVFLALMLSILLRPPGHLAVNRFSVFIILSGLFPIGSTIVGWVVAARSRKIKAA
jgi:hypothetical protein